MNDMTTAPLVSILLPTRNRWDYFCLALESAVSQTYPHIEVIVSDNSTEEQVSARIQSHVAGMPRVKYFRASGKLEAMENFQRCLDLSSGELISFLMDDDLYHPEKIAVMAQFLVNNKQVSLVTSYRQTIDEQGNERAAISATARLVEKPTVLDSFVLRKYIIHNFLNVIGEPTTPLFRRSDLEEQRFGYFYKKQYYVLADLATWFTIMSKGNVVYLPQAYSQFRIHSEQDQKGNKTKLIGYNEWMQLIRDAFATEVLNEDEFDQAMAFWGRYAADRLVSVPQQLDLDEPCVEVFAENMGLYFQWANRKLAGKILRTDREE